MLPMRSTLYAFIVVLQTSNLLLAENIDFNRDILPILSDKCFHCHGPDSQARQADLRLDTRAGLFQTRGEVTPVVANNPAKSELLRRVTSLDLSERMPPREAKLSLTSQEIELLTRWIKAGARWTKHWSFQAVKRPEIPLVTPNSSTRNAIDAFVITELSQAKRQLAQAALPERFLRRVTFDLTGLPPSLDEIDSFLTDPSPDRNARLIDRLLCAPAYGERMAWEWLDAARYADSNGFQGDRERTMWPWRDWVIDQLNYNLPYDEFSVRQIAGDLLPNSNEQQRLATGFCRNHMINGEGGRIPEENRVEYIFDQIETVGTIWLGMTMQCCRCHDHKYDPLSQQDYYQMFAFFNQTPVDGSGGNPQTPPVIAAPSHIDRYRITALETQIETLRSQSTQRLNELAKIQASWESMQLEELRKNPWHLLHPQSATAEHQELTILADASVLASGVSPPNDTYQVSVTTDEPRITAVRLEALRHESLFGGSLSKAESGNFVLTGFEMQIQRTNETRPRPVKFTKTKASFEQGTLTVAATLDENQQTGWGVWDGRLVDQEHAAVLIPDSPLDAGPNTKLIFVLRHDSDFAKHIVGRFRLSVTAQTEVQPRVDTSLLFEALKTPTKQRTPDQKQLITKTQHKSDTKYNHALTEIATAQQAVEDLRKTLPQVMIMEDMPNPRTTHVLERGLYNKPTNRQVAARLPEMFAVPASDTARNRLALARWLTGPANPLGARVTVNRYWQTFFGTGLVKTANNFGAQGEKPSHRELLDWLAAEFVHTDWDVKALHRKITNSSCYQQSAKQILPNDLHSPDTENRLLTRGPRRRMPSWMIRDQALAVSGLQVRNLGGPPVKPYQPPGVWAEATFGNKRYTADQGEKLYRRSLYTFWRRIVGPTMLFDVAKRQTCVVSNTQTNTPLHALVTMNDITFLEAARMLAEDAIKSPALSDAQQLAFVFRKCTTRQPTTQEIKTLMDRLYTTREHFSVDPDAATAFLSVGDAPRDETVNSADHAAFMVICLLVLNLDETLTR